MKKSQQEQESNFWGNRRDLLGGRGYLGIVLARVLRATTKKGLQFFWGRKVHPQRKSWLRLCSGRRIIALF